MKPFLRHQLERYAQRLGELDFLLSREDIMSDMAQYRVISREHAEVTQIAGRYARYQQREADLAGAREMLDDPDMAEMAQEEIAGAVFRLGMRQLEVRLDTPLRPLTNVRLRLTYPTLGQTSGDLYGKVLAAEQQQGVCVMRIRLTSVDAMDQKIIDGFLGV